MLTYSLDSLGLSSAAYHEPQNKSSFNTCNYSLLLKKPRARHLGAVAPQWSSPISLLLCPRVWHLSFTSPRGPRGPGHWSTGQARRRKTGRREKQGLPISQLSQRALHPPSQDFHSLLFARNLSSRVARPSDKGCWEVESSVLGAVHLAED